MKRPSVKWRKIRQELESEDYIHESRIGISPTIFLMCSGGVDSMFLLDFMSRCKIRFDVLHFSHNIRSLMETSKDIITVKRGVEKANENREHQITLHLGYGKDLDGANSEHKCHEARKAFIREQQHRIQREYYNSSYVTEKRKESHDYVDYEIHGNTPRCLVITAHNLNDNMEQVFMSMMRGESHKRLAMKAKMFGVGGDPNVLRPFLDVPKSDIIASAKYRGVEWNEDYTNQDNKHERNWVRNIIIPQMMLRRNVETAMRDSLREASDLGFY